MSSNDMTRTIDVYDSEVAKIGEVMAVLQDRASMRRDYEAFSQEIKTRFEEIGFVVNVQWYETNVEGVLMPEVNIVGRTDEKFVFDRDQMTHEVTRDVLGLGTGGVIKTNTPEFSEQMRQVERDFGKGHSHDDGDHHHH